MRRIYNSAPDDDRDMYRRPYLALFNGMTDARMALERGDCAMAKELLRRAQEDAEDAFAPDSSLWYGCAWEEDE